MQILTAIRTTHLFTNMQLGGYLQETERCGGMEYIIYGDESGGRGIMEFIWKLFNRFKDFIAELKQRNS